MYRTPQPDSDTRLSSRRIAWILLASLTFSLFGLGLATSTDAALIAFEQFLTGNPANAANGEYAVTHLRRAQASGAGQNPTVLGFSGAWTGNVTSGTLAVAQWTAESAPTGTTVPYHLGGRARFAGFTNDPLQRRVQRALAPYGTSNTYYMSIITQIATGDAAGTLGFVGAGFTNSDPTVSTQDANLVGGSALRGLLIGATSSNGMTTDFVVRHVGSSGVVQDDVLQANIASVIPTLTIMKLEFNDDPGNPSGNSKLTIWHNPTDYSSEAAASLSVTPVELRTFGLSSNADLTHLTLTGINYSKAASFDEIALGTTWDDMKLPEPTTSALAGLVLILRGATRSRRQG